MDPGRLMEAGFALGLFAASIFPIGWVWKAGGSLAPAFFQVIVSMVAISAVPFPLAGRPTLLLLAVIAVPRFPLSGRDRLGLGVIGANTAALGWIFAPFLETLGALSVFLATTGGLQLFTWAGARIVAKEARTSRALARALEALSASQAVWAAAERLGERVRIARDLHDSIGHHLTTLSLTLDLARRQKPEEARANLDTAHTLCRLLLAELRDVLADVRSTDGQELAGALKEMVSRVPGLAIELTIEPDLGPIDPDRAHALLRCGQEVITNTLRHAEAGRLSIDLRRHGDVLELSAHDDGRGLVKRRPGGGLDAIEKRLQEFGGRLSVQIGTGGSGTTVVAAMPAPLEAS